MKKQVAPHIHTKMNISLIYPNALIALLPCILSAVFYYGIRAFLLILLSMLFSLLCDYLFVHMIRKERYIWEGSPLVSGAILALILPPQTPIWMLMIGVFFSCAVAKQSFGGLGSNLFNPALASKAFLMLMFPWSMISYAEPITSRWQFDSLLYGTFVRSVSEAPASVSNVMLFELFSGRYAGNLGTTCAAMILLGGLYLIFTGISRITAPLAYFATLCAGYFLFFDPATISVDGMLRFLLTDGFLFVAVFAMSDFSTTPITSLGRSFFGAGAGILTVLLVRLGNPAFAAIFPVLFMNAVTPILDLYIRPRIYGRPGSLHGKPNIPAKEKKL